MLRLDKLCKRYKTGDEALKSVTLEIPDGQVLALIGPSGAGKSTLFDLMLRFYDCQLGSIKLDGIDIRRLDLYALRKCYAIALP